MKNRSTKMTIGERIKDVFMRMPKICTVDWLAKELHCDRRNIYRIFQKDNIDIELLGRISRILNYDFFKDLSDSLEIGDTNDKSSHK